MSKAGDSLLRGAREALAYAKGEADVSQYGVHVPKSLDVKAIRQKVEMSQQDFAGYFGVSRRTIQEWEQGRRCPSGAARAFLVVIDREPKAVRRALTADHAQAIG
jgi:putative transcriptional regulator